MQYTNGTFRGVGGYDLFYQAWRPERKPKAVVGIVHGFGEHGGRFMNLVNHLVALDYAVYAYDQRGFGRSPGQRGHINDRSELQGDLSSFLALMERQEQGQPVFLYGHSMGAVVLFEYLLTLKPSLCGAILSATPIILSEIAPAYKLLLAGLVSKVWPRLSVKAGIDNTAISRDPAVVEAKINDPLAHDLTTVKFASEMADTVKGIRHRIPKAEIDYPLLLLHGEADRISPVRGSQWLHKTMKASNKQLITYPGGYHEPHNDINHAQVTADVSAWLDRQQDECKHELRPLESAGYIT